jgi:Flp pilus assembly protein TadG
VKKILSLKKNTEGQSLVEFALVLPLLLALVLGMVEFGWILNAKITLTSAAREGARFYAVSKDASKVEATVKKTTVSSGLTVTEVKTETEEGYKENIHNVKVTVKGNIDPIIGLYFKGSVPMESIAIMREE